ncbi:hypothetical protein [Adhaeribacter arboris]|uniref:hypothetical protein n=1 Tax=Adhaeribacter arboris TaxID=2072846 RepID=UPI001304C75D|nr:hypothetical protein [Adhaeribacter arboris]
MPFIFNPLFHLALGITGIVSTGVLVKDILSIRKQLLIETGKIKMNKSKIK